MITATVPMRYRSAGPTSFFSLSFCASSRTIRFSDRAASTALIEVSRAMESGEMMNG